LFFPANLPGYGRGLCLGKTTTASLRKYPAAFLKVETALQQKIAAKSQVLGFETAED
jgi:hypothetical protein